MSGALNSSNTTSGERIVLPYIFDSGIDQWLYWQANSRPDFYAWKADRLHTVDDAASGHFDQLARPVLSPFHSTEVNDG